MNNKAPAIWLPFILLIFFSFGAVTSKAGTPTFAETVTDSVFMPVHSAEVNPFGTPVFKVYSGIGPFSMEERAKAVEKKIISIADDPFFHTDSIKLESDENSMFVKYGESVITVINEKDAHAENSTILEIARKREAKILYAIKQYRKDNNLSNILKNAAFSIGILVLFFFLAYITGKLFGRFSVKLEGWKGGIFGIVTIREYNFLNRSRQLAILLGILKLTKWFITLLLFIASLFAVFYLLPWTKAFSLSILEIVLKPLKNILISLWEYLPNLITIIIILIVSRMILKMFRIFKSEIEKGNLKIPGFYADWSLPTFNIIRVLVIVFTVVALWPYLPGSGSQVFQGVSVFLGLVFSLTSASALSNFMAGLTLTYTRAFRLGDRVRIGDVTGDIIEKSMLVTKVRTIKNEEITIPNNKIMNSEVINFSTCAPEMGLILHTTVTIGYDAPWQQVHQLLIEAALNTSRILSKPNPFVLQTALNDFYISYQINAFTRAPNEMAVILSDLHQNIQDSFNKAGVEIMSPHYKAIRDGNTIAIPEENRGEGYEPPSFRVNQTKA